MNTEYIWSSRQSSIYVPKDELETENQEAVQNYSPLVLSLSLTYPNIIDISQQTDETGLLEIMKNPIVATIFEHLTSKNEAELKIKSSIDDTIDSEFKEINKWTSDSQKLKILEQFFLKNQSRAKIARELLVSYSTIWRIIRNYGYSPHSIASLFKKRQVRLQEWKRAQAKAIEFIKSQTSIFNSKDVQTYIKSEAGVEINQQSISWFMKRNLSMNYVRVSSRPVAKDTDIILLKQIIFWLEFGHLIRKDHIVLSIDETLFSNSTKINYSWIANNKANIWSNSSFQGSLSIIAAITCKGDWFISNLTSNNNSDNFIWFVEHLMTWLRDDIGVQTNRIVLLMDNSRIHTSIKCKKFLNLLGWRVMFLSPYSPQFAPIELMFRVLKQRLSIHWKDQIINLKKSDGFKQVKEWMATVDRSLIISFWRHAVRRIKLTIE